MRKTVYLVSIISVILTAVSVLLYSHSQIETALTFAITFGTISYHFLMRLAVGLIIDTLMKNKADYNAKWYSCTDGEKAIYKRIKIKKWKNRLPTFQPDYFDPKKHSPDEIAQAMCQAEIVHEVIIVLSFIPILFSHWFGALAVFIITSVLAALLDLLFVITQRFNRPRMIRLINRNSKK